MSDLAGRFTGRHWWGVLDDDVADPVIGAAAEAIARALGLPDFGPDETGTTIVILGADLGLISDEETALHHYQGRNFCG